MYLIRNKVNAKHLVSVRTDAENDRYEICYKDYTGNIPTELVINCDLSDWYCFLTEVKRVYNEQMQRAEYKCYYKRYKKDEL